MNHSLILIIVAVGGAIGAICRFQITHWFTPLAAIFPYATLLVNVVGSFMMGLLTAYIMQGTLLAPFWKPLIGVGFLGALTTFSSFSIDTFTLFTQGEWLKAMINVLANVLLCLLAVSVGYYLVAKQ